jgi:hypothetical protein
MGLSKQVSTRPVNDPFISSHGNIHLLLKKHKYLGPWLLKPSFVAASFDDRDVPVTAVASSTDEEIRNGKS